MATLEAEIVHYLRDLTNGSQNATRVEARKNLRARVGDNIFLGRIPANVRSPYVLTLQRISTIRFADCYGEANIAQALIQFTVLGRESPAIVQQVCEQHVRLALNSYRGTLGKEGTEITDSVVERDGLPTPSDPYEGSDDWKFQYSMDILFTFDQEAI